MENDVKPPELMSQARGTSVVPVALCFCVAGGPNAASAFPNNMSGFTGINNNNNRLDLYFTALFFLICSVAQTSVVSRELGPPSPS